MTNKSPEGEQKNYDLSDPGKKGLDSSIYEKAERHFEEGDIKRKRKKYWGAFSNNSTELVKKYELTPEKKDELFLILETRFYKRHDHYWWNKGKNINFNEVKNALEARPDLICSLAQMENTDGAPDIIAVESDAFIFGDCSAQSPDRRNITYDQAVEMAKQFGVELMSEEIYLTMQKKGIFDSITSSWLASPTDIIINGHRYGPRGTRYAEPGGAANVKPGDGRNRHESTGWRGVLRIPKV